MASKKYKFAKGYSRWEESGMATYAPGDEITLTDDQAKAIASYLVDEADAEEKPKKGNSKPKPKADDEADAEE